MAPDIRKLHINTINDLNASLESAEEHDLYPVFFIPVLSRAHPARSLARTSDILVSELDGMVALDYLPIIDDGGPEAGPAEVKSLGGLVYVMPTEFDHVWYLVTMAGNPFIRERLSNSLERARRSIPGFSLTNPEMYDLISGVQSTDGRGGPTSKYAVLRSRAGAATTDHKPQPIADVFRWAAERGDVVQRIKASCMSPRLEFMLYRDGSVRLFCGQWAAFEKRLKDPILAKAAERYASVTNRARTSFEEVGRPFEILYDQDVFTSREDNFGLVHALQNAGTSSVAVLHANPYLHAGVVDLVDGGYADVFVTSSRTVSIVPGYRASEGSLLRIVRAIFDGVSEGRLVEQPRKPKLTLSDVMEVA